MSYKPPRRKWYSYGKKNIKVKVIVHWDINNYSTPGSTVSNYGCSYKCGHNCSHCDCVCCYAYYKHGSLNSFYVCTKHNYSRLILNILHLLFFSPLNSTSPSIQALYHFTIYLIHQKSL